MLNKISSTLLGFVVIIAAVSLVYGALCALGYVGLMIPFFGLVTDHPLFANGAIVAFSLLVLACAGCFLIFIASVAFKSSHFVGDQCVRMLRKFLCKPKMKTDS